MNLIEELDNFIQMTQVAQEQKRALAAKMAVLRKPSSEIQALLGVSREFVTKWKNKAIFEGVESLRLQYKGSKGYLSTEEKVEKKRKEIEGKLREWEGEVKAGTLCVFAIDAHSLTLGRCRRPGGVTE